MCRASSYGSNPHSYEDNFSVSGFWTTNKYEKNTIIIDNSMAIKKKLKLHHIHCKIMNYGNVQNYQKKKKLKEKKG